MYEFVKLSDRCGYIKNPANVGVVSLGGGDVCLIDSGSDGEAARKILKKIRENEWNVRCIINTHSIADHTGGNQFIQSRTNCSVLSTDVECAIARNSYIEPSYLWGGRPYAELRNKFLMAKPTPQTKDLEANLPEGLQIIKLPGHYFDMVGIMACDGTCYIADAVFAEEIVRKYHIVFIYDVAKFLETLDMLDTLEAKIFVPAHAEPSADIRALTAANRAKVLEVAELIYDICSEPITFEKILKKLFDHYDLTMNHNQYVLVGSTVRSYIAYLHDGGRIDAEFIGNEMFWKKTN